MRLRGRIEKIKGDIRGKAAYYKKQMDDIRAEIETLDYDKREPHWKKIDEPPRGDVCRVRPRP